MDDLRFLHIPKTAGSTFAGILISEYGICNHFQFIGSIDQNIKKWNDLSKAKQVKTKLFLCHSPIVTGIKKADNATIITLLRDPVNRVKSFCQHVYEGKSPYLKKKFPPATFSLDKFLNSGEMELKNLQVNILTGQTTGGNTISEGIKQEKQLAKAWEILTRYISCYGLLEEFDDSILLFKEKLGWKKDPLYVRVNKKSKTRQLEFKPHHLEKIIELNTLDIALYEKAKKHFQEQIAQNVSTEEQKRFRDLNTKQQPATALKWMFTRLFLKLERMSLGST